MTNDTMEDFRSNSYRIAQAIAPGWERWRAQFERAVIPVRQWMINELAPQPGQTLLELAAGAGDTGFEAAEIIGQDGGLVCTDFSPAMLDVARRRGVELGLRNVDYRVMDAEHVELDTDSVDGVLCRFGYMLMSDAAAALSETRRVLRPGGRLTLAVWSAPDRKPFFAIVARALAERGHLPPADPGAPSPFSMASQQRTRALLEGAGFGSVGTAELPVRFAFRDLDEYMSFMADTAGPLAMVLRAPSEDEREAVKTDLLDAFGDFVSGRRHELPGVALAATAS